jgi:hypothetical protein
VHLDLSLVQRDSACEIKGGAWIAWAGRAGQKKGAWIAWAGRAGQKKVPCVHTRSVPKTHRAQLGPLRSFVRSFMNRGGGGGGMGGGAVLASWGVLDHPERQVSKVPILGVSARRFFNPPLGPFRTRDGPKRVHGP